LAAAEGRRVVWRISAAARGAETGNSTEDY